MALIIEESLDRGLEWTVFEPNDEPTWTLVRRQVETAPGKDVQTSRARAKQPT